LNGGVRDELTESYSQSYTLNFGPTGTYLGATRATAKKSYDDFFPSAVATYCFSDRIMLRGGVTRSTARPDYNQILGGRIVQDDVDRITEGNPTLQPLKATNYDLSFEWYLTSAGVFSVGTFYKDITNFVYSTVSTLTEAPYTGWQLTRPMNGPHSTLTGYEFSYSQNFKSLPPPFNGLGFSGNYTRLEGTSVLPTVRGKVDRLIEQPQNVYNLQLSYEKFPFSVRVAAVYNGDYVRSFNATTAAQDAWTNELKTYDASINYTMRPGWVFYLQGKNLGNSFSKYAYQGEGRKDLPTELEFVGWTLSAGLKMEF
jgi:TonB-dependent receptor